jgi:hypothetical protein
MGRGQDEAVAENGNGTRLGLLHRVSAASTSSASSTRSAARRRTQHERAVLLQEDGGALRFGRVDRGADDHAEHAFDRVARRELVPSFARSARGRAPSGRSASARLTLPRSSSGTNGLVR